MRTQLGDLAFDGGPLAVEVFELGGGLALTRGLEQGFMIIQDNRAALRLAVDTAFKQRAGFTGLALKEEGRDPPALIVVRAALSGRRLALRTGDGVGRSGRS